jgi:TonB family protein
MILGLFLASSLTLSTPANNPGRWLSDRDYPASAIRRREQGAVGFRLLISPEGRVARCEVIISSHSPDLDRATCDVIIAQSKFKPAKDEVGQPNYSMFIGRLTWLLPGHALGVTAPPFQPDFEITVQKLPDGSRIKMVQIVTKFDPTGQLAVCEPGDSRKDMKLVVVACAQAKTVPIAITKDDDGNSISVIRRLSILFKTAG